MKNHRGRLGYRGVRSAGELSSLLKILGPIFSANETMLKRYVSQVGRENFRMLTDGREVCGGLALIPMGQYFGGVSVPMIGVAFVGVRPEGRVRGTASEMMRLMLEEMHEEGAILSGLYPATLPLYRRAGYELSGSRFEIRLPLRQIEIGRREMADARDMELRAYRSSDQKAINEVHRARCRMSAGGLERGRFHWARVHRWRGDDATGTIVVNPKSREIEGYAFLIQKAEEMRFSLFGTDVAAITPAAAKRLVAFFADHRSMVETLTFGGSSADVVMRALPEKAANVQLIDHWMTRIVNVKGALEARGYSPVIDAQVEFEVEDDLLKDNARKWTLGVSKGRGRVKQGGSGAMNISIRGLAAIYTGFLSAEEAAQSGLMACTGSQMKKREMLARLSGVFAGPTPWMSDRY